MFDFFSIASLATFCVKSIVNKILQESDSVKSEEESTSKPVLSQDLSASLIG